MVFWMHKQCANTANDNVGTVPLTNKKKKDNVGREDGERV